jgi:CzcA family heavy metal efflux pump
MWIVRLALSRPYTMAVLAVVITVLGFLSITRMSTDIFPEIDIPIVSVIWTYRGMSAEELERRVTTFSEYAISGNVNDIRKVESQTVEGVAIIKVFFHPNANIGNALAQVTAASQAIRAILPPGIQPPIILRFNASSVPIIQLSLSSKTVSESDVYDYALWQVRQQLSVIQGQTIPTPYGGKERQIMVDLDPELLQARGVSPQQVAEAINANNLAFPTGSARIDSQQYPVSMNNTPLSADAFNDIPVKSANGQTIFMRDIAQVRDGFPGQTTVVRRDGNRGALVTILKNGGASTLDIVKHVKEMLPQLRATAPKGVDIDVLFDQSVFVQAAVSGVVEESVIAGILTALMILMFLASWRSTLIVAVSIPLAILASLTALFSLGYTLNVMTLGGLALAVGILVDDATVEIENIHRNVGMGKKLRTAILDGASQIAAPTFVATLTICIVFVSVLFLDGPAKYLFTPMALGVVFAMLASYLLSRTLVPMMANYLLPAEVAQHNAAHKSAPGFFGRFSQKFETLFEALRALYISILTWNLQHRKMVFAIFAAVIASGALLLPRVGQDFFPTVDSGQFRLHVRTPPGTRLEETERYFTAVEDAIRTIVPKHETELVIDNIGLPNRSYSMAFGDSSTTGAADGEILVALKHERAKSTPAYIADLRRELPRRFPDLVFYFQPADIVSQILNFGLPAPIDIQIAGLAREKNQQTATQIAERLKKIAGVTDVHVHQVTNVPELHIDVDKTRALQMGFTQRDVAQNMLVSLSGSQQVLPNYWVDPKNGISYVVESRTPLYKVDSLGAINSIPIVSADGSQRQLLANVATVQRQTTAETVNHNNIQPTFDVFANVQGRDLGSVAHDIEPLLNEFRAHMAPGNSIIMRGQVESMQSAFLRLGLGILFAALLVYLLMVVNFQSWLDPFIIITALPGALVGIVWMLIATKTTFSVPSLMGAIMAIGVATANSILLVTFANGVRHEGKNALEAAIEAGRTRMRPVLMTALAMVIGMMPMALGLGEGGEQNAPLARAVIGGLLLATATTLLFVPVVYSVLRKAAPQNLDVETE